MKAIDQWLTEYGESHQNPTNKAIHWVCVPAIFFSIIGILYAIKLPMWLPGDFQLNIALFVLLFVIGYYIALSRTLWVGILIFSLLCFGLCYVIERYVPVKLWIVSVVLFVLAWIGQFYGHSVEGKKPSFLKDLQFLLIGPAWLMSFIYKKLKVPL